MAETRDELRLLRDVASAARRLTWYLRETGVKEVGTDARLSALENACAAYDAAYLNSEAPAEPPETTTPTAENQTAAAVSVETEAPGEAPEELNSGDPLELLERRIADLETSDGRLEGVIERRHLAKLLRIDVDATRKLLASSMVPKSALLEKAATWEAMASGCRTKAENPGEGVYQSLRLQRASDMEECAGVLRALAQRHNKEGA